MTTSKFIQLILAGQLASSVVTPMLLVDDQDVPIYYNEPALEGATFQI